VDVSGIYSTKRSDFNRVELSHEWKLFCFGVESTMSAQAGIRTLENSRIACCVNERIPLGEARHVELGADRPIPVFSGVGGGGAGGTSAPPEVLFVENAGKIHGNLGKHPENTSKICAQHSSI